MVTGDGILYTRVCVFFFLAIFEINVLIIHSSSACRSIKQIERNYFDFCMPYRFMFIPLTNAVLKSHPCVERGLASPPFAKYQHGKR